MFSGVVDNTEQVLRTIFNSWIVLQPVYWTSAIKSHLLLSWWKNDALAVSGISISSLISPLASAAFTPFTRAAPTGASVGGSAPSEEAVGLLKLAGPVMLYLILER